jgi:hypothetical protein
MSKKYNLNVRVDEEKSLVYANLSVPYLPEWRGFYKYNVEDVCKMLREQGYNVKSKGLVSATTLTVRTDDKPSTKGQWVLRLKTNKVEFKPGPKPGPKTDSKPEPTKLDLPVRALEPKAVSKKKKAPKTTRAKRKATKQTTKEVLEAYKKENN